ncbi:MAG: ribosomal protein S18-alanine N-acetyltransferase [Armatimonadetes bacterium]|nr:ribosomal protein S18-alanine N-acetyltransferase [Armatimonadota bacterium]
MLATLRFVPLDKTHIPRILEIEHVTHSAPWSQKSFENELEHKYGVFLVGLVDGDVGAYGGVWILVDEAHVTNVVVCEHLRNQGIGRKLMIELLTRAREKGAVCATLEVRASNVGAIHLYETLGFVQSTVRNKYYPDNQEDAVVMMLNDLLSWKPGA